TMTLIPAAGGSQRELHQFAAGGSQRELHQFAAGGSQSFLPAAGESQGFLHDQTVPAEQRVVRLAPARLPTGFPPPSRGSIVAEAGATLGIALSGISRNKARTTLTLLGMIIRVASVITAVGIGTGQAAQVNAQISSLGTNLVTVQPGASFSGGVRGGAGSANTLTQSDVNALAAQMGPAGA